MPPLVYIGPLAADGGFLGVTLRHARGAVERARASRHAVLPKQGPGFSLYLVPPDVDDAALEA